jgi:hypothetical protein
LQISFDLTRGYFLACLIDKSIIIIKLIIIINIPNIKLDLITILTTIRIVRRSRSIIRLRNIK